jgi:hypothetical protein
LQIIFNPFEINTAGNPQSQESPASRDLTSENHQKNPFFAPKSAQTGRIYWFVPHGSRKFRLEAVTT